MTERAVRPLLVRGQRARAGEIVAVTPHGSVWNYISFRALKLASGDVFQADTRSNEALLVVIEGTVHINSAAGAWQSIGKRADPFSGPAESVYLPASTAYEIRASTAAEVAICEAPARQRFPARHIVSSGHQYIRGEGHARRRIDNILMEPDAAGTLFVTEVVTFPGNWSSYPPHKHDEDNPPIESQLEELYYYRARPASGFAFQRVYTAAGDLDETMTVGDGDAVLVPRGYHVCAAAAEYWIYYLNVLAGPKHLYHITFDPAHAWIKENWTW